MFITAFIPTYRRPQDLQRCLEGLKQQTRPADEVLVVVRDIDTETWEFFKTYDAECLPLRTITATVPGHVPALNIGLDEANGDLICITDDDACPHPDWLVRIEAHFATNLQVAGVGGRDWVYQGMRLVEGRSEIVGKVQWFGRVIANHHLGVGKAREVDVLKGANMSYRKAAVGELQFDQRLQGQGLQVHDELAFCLALRRAGWVLVYDPQVAVDHYSSDRAAEADQRDQFNPAVNFSATCNETLLLLEHFPPAQQIIFLIWAVFIGTSESMGLIQWLRFLPSQGARSTQKLIACLRGRWRGLQLWQQSQLGCLPAPAVAPRIRSN
ncbi:MAG: glycosyltransferase family 2 protein [Cyanobacteria bacterium CAN_BIN43]|nr:glycosyltransferase family 2 protein [Cyanobacteria bacterium CAN_BIN43]